MDDEQAVSTVRLKAESAFSQGDANWEMYRLKGCFYSRSKQSKLLKHDKFEEKSSPGPLKIENITYAICKNTGAGTSEGIWSWVIPIPRLYHPMI